MAAAPAPDDSPSLDSLEEVMFFDTDAGGVVHNIAYLRFIETCRTRLGARLGLDLRSMAQRQQFAVVLRTEIDYRRPALLGDHLVIHGRLERLERVRFHCAFEIHRPADTSHLVSCRQSLALVQLPDARPIRLPEHWRAQWPHLESPSPPSRSSPR
ncbi:MAG: acyl-CoA thioesterase [Verrucomicrobiales bacterium]